MHAFSFALSASLFFVVSSIHGAVAANSPARPAAHPVHAAASDLAPGALARRDALMKQGTADLAAGDTNAAATAFESAVSMVHAPDAEIGLVRSYLQAGQFRQALSYSAHTAGAHKEEPEGTALYVWLLHMSGQQAAAKRVLFEAQARAPSDAVLARAQRWIESSLASSPKGVGAASACAPCSLPPLTTSTAATSGSGVLIDSGRYALVSMTSVAHARKIWLRNGLGQLRKAVVENRIEQDGMALLKLDQALPLPEGFTTAGRDPFPGSVVYSTGYSMARGAQPEWPVLRHGFLGTPVGNSPDWELGITMPKGLRGGPVFDASGALAGMSILAPHGKPMFMPIGRMRRALGDRLGPVAPPMRGPRLAIEQVYENAMRVTVQVLTDR